LFACWPFVGHINPYMSVALALRARGHDVAFYASQHARPTIEAEGFPVFPFEHVDEQYVRKIVRLLETGTPVGQKSVRVALRTFQNWLVGTMPAQIADLEPIIDCWRPDVLVAETAMWGPILVLWEAIGIPVAILSTLLVCLVPGPEAPAWGLGLPPLRNLRSRLLARAADLATDLFAAPMRRRVDRIRAAHGLAPMGCSVNAFTGRLPLYLVPGLPELDYNRGDLPPSVHYVGPCVWNKPSRAAPPSWLEQIPADRPWVHVTEGTIHAQDPFVLRAAMRGLANERMEVILTTGPQRELAALNLGPMAPNIRVLEWVSHSDLLPRCSAIVTTGGAGTVITALQMGVPLVVVPTHWDKPDNARRVVEAGVGLRVAPRDCTPERLRQAVRRLLDEPDFRRNAQCLAQRLATAPGPPGAAALLEALVGTRMPSLEHATRAQ
jgi:MGT family glycosyltransferase